VAAEGGGARQGAPGRCEAAYAIGLAQAGDWKGALHEAKEAIRIDWRERERLILGIEKLTKLVDKYACKQLDSLIAKVRLL